VINRENKPPRAYEVMDSVLQRGDAVELARLLSCAPQLVRAWCRPPETTEEFSNTGKFGPLDRLRTIVTMIKEDDVDPDRAYPIGQYVARLLGGCFVPQPPPACADDSDLLQRICAVLKETAEAVEAVRRTELEKERSTLAERAACMREVDEAIAALCQVKHYLDPSSR